MRMLIEFTVENYRSFRDRATLSMVAAKIKSHFEELDKYNVAEVAKNLKLLRAAAIYGANASGKSNLTSNSLWLATADTCRYLTSVEVRCC